MTENALQIFSNDEFGKIRAILVDGEPWFVGKDVAAALGYSNTRDALARHVDDDDKGVVKHDTLGGAQDLGVINESGLYSLIMGSKLDSAKRFKRWVTAEVLPAIRKTGVYNIAGTDDEFLALAVIKAKRLLDERDARIKQLSEQAVETQKLISELQPKADYVDQILQSKSLVLVTQIAKDYGTSAKTFNRWLHDLHVQYKAGGQWLLYAKYQACGYVHSETIQFARSDGTPDTKMQTKWTQKGRLFLYNLLKKNGIVPVIERV